MAKSMYDIIKKQNGERFAQAIRAYDNGIFDIPNIDKTVKYAGQNAEPILSFLESLKNIKIEEHGVYQDPITLLDQAGYNAYYADTLEKQNAISQYFQADEKLCTFRDKSRFKKYFIVHAVHKDVKNIRRTDFPNPEREDRYGTSVISIQILKTGGFISIKNRYNHTVENCDNTFGSNPDNIIKGLSASLEHYFNVDFSAQDVELPQNFAFVKGKIIHYEREIENTYFGKNFYCQDGEITEVDNVSRLMLDYFVLDLKKNKIINPAIDDCFPDILQKEIDGKQLKVSEGKDGVKTLYADGTEILKVKNGKMISLTLPNTVEIGNNFLYYQKTLISFNGSKVQKISKYFLYENTDLKNIQLPEAQEVGEYFLHSNEAIERINFPKLVRIGNIFMDRNEIVKSIRLPNAEKIGHNFLISCKAAKGIVLPKARSIGWNFLAYNENILIVKLPCLERVRDGFLYHNKALNVMIAPKLDRKTYGDLLGRHKHVHCFKQRSKNKSQPGSELQPSKSIWKRVHEALFQSR